ncbi:hypothetical protein AB4144_35195, partial [Rhizobiaceae sp. 2RAB30]
LLHFSLEPFRERNVRSGLAGSPGGAMRTWQLELEIARLADATERIICGEADVSRQRALVEGLLSQGDGTTEAQGVLAELMTALANWRADRDLIEEAIARLT